MHLVRGDEPADGGEASADPRTKEAWFKNLPEEYQERFGEHFEKEVAHTEELERREKRRIWKEVAAAAGLLVLFDFLSPAHTLETTLLAAVVGAALGWLCGAMDATRNYAAVMGMTVFLAFQLMTRGGFATVHFFWVVVLGVAFAYMGYKREERHY
jgi:hypothetical protein